jgi:basic membrane protein A and related proteins
MFAQAALKGEPLPNFVRGGLVEGFVKTSAYEPAVPDAGRNQAEAVKAETPRGC